MGSIAAQFASVYRDYITDGVPASGPNDPVKADIRAIGPTIEAALGTLSLGSVSVTKDTRAHLNADLAHAADTVALVYADGTDANNDLYVKVGASGSGSWTLTGILHLAISGLTSPAVTAAAASAAAAAASASSIISTNPAFLGRDRYRRFYDELYSLGLYTPVANDDGKYTPTLAQIGYWAVLATGDLAPGKTVSFYVRTDSGTYSSAPTLKFYDSSNAQVGTTQTATATDADGNGRAIENVTIPATTATIRAGHQTASTSDIYEAHLCAGPTTQHLRFVNLNRIALIEERALVGIRREPRAIGGNVILVNVPNGDARVYEKLVTLRGGSLSSAERNAIFEAADMLKRFGLVDKLAAFYPFIGTGLGAMCTPLIDRYGYGRLIIAGSSTFVSGDWNPLNGLSTVYPSAATLLADTGIIPSEHGFGNDRYGIAIYNLADRSNSIGLPCVGASDPQTTSNATPTAPVHGFFGGFAGAAIMSFGDGGTSQLTGNAAIKTGSGSGSVTTVKTAGSWVGARREDGSGLMTYNGMIANTNTGGGESTTPITLTSIPSESIKISNGTDPLGAVAIINGPMEPADHINLHYVMHRLNQYPGVRTSPPAIEGLF